MDSIHEVKQIFQEWGFAEYVTSFEDEDIDIEAFDLLDSAMIKSLFPKAGLRLKFQKRYNYTPIQKYCVGAPTAEERIVGGTVAQVGGFPYLVSVRFQNSHGCGGSILDERHILTAAHCVYGVSPIYVSIQYGTVDIGIQDNVIQVSGIKIHENYIHDDNYPNDVAILTLSSDIQFNNTTVKVASLATEDPKISKNSKLDAVLAGWGYEDEQGEGTGGIVQRYCLRTNLPLLSHDTCQKLLPTYDPKVHVCAGSLDGKHKQCAGDSGGPLNVKGVQYGIVSWSFRPCSIENKPGIFTNLGMYRDWVRKNSGV